MTKDEAIAVCTAGKTAVLGVDKEHEVVFVPLGLLHLQQELTVVLAVGSESLAAKLIMQSQTFSVNFLSKKHKDPLKRLMGATSSSLDTFAIAQMGKREGEKIDCPVIPESRLILECSVSAHVKSDAVWVFIGSVLHAVKS